MSRRTASLFAKGLFTVLALAVPLILGGGDAWAAVQYLKDGGVQSTRGGLDLPAQGTCPADPTLTNRPDCLALRFPAYTTSADCTAAATGGANRSWSTGVCNDLINNADEATCEAQPDRMWSNGTCSIVMKGDDRNNVVCAQHQGTWVTAGVCTGNWIMPARDDARYGTGGLLTSNGAGDWCLRCHNSITQYNGTRIRDVEWFLRSGHLNMVRKVTPGMPWGGPPFECSNPLFTDASSCMLNGETWDPVAPYVSDDSGNVFHWDTGKITVNSVDRDLTWIYGDWLAPLPRAVYKTNPSATQVCSDPRGTTANCVATYGGTLIYNAGASYSCGRCHATGWTSDAAINTAKEPEKSFPGITWDRNSDAGFGVVNMSGGVTGDPNKYSSWDTWGVSCARCHHSAVDNQVGLCTWIGLPDSATCTAAPYSGTWTAATSTCTKSGVALATCTGTPVAGTLGAPFSAPTGMSTHHNDLTAFDVSTSGDTGYCTDPRFSAQAQCSMNGGAWLTQCSTAGACSDATKTDTAACLGVGSCSNPTYTTWLACVNGGGTWTSTNTWTRYGSQTTCEGATFTWARAGLDCTTGACCSVAGVCNNAAYTNSIDCAANGGQWAIATNAARCEDADGRWTGSKTQRGQIIMRVCMDCHRQETGGMPYANATSTAGTYDTVNPGSYVKVGPAHGTVSPVSHPGGNMFLNSPHARFTGTFNQIVTGKPYAPAGYSSYFMMDGEAANTGNGCTGCHDIHFSIVEDTGYHGALREECTECHAGPYAKPLNEMLHPTGPDTPAENMDTEPAEACEICHMPEGMHLWRINTSPVYSTFPAAALTATVNANTSPEGTFTSAVWVDVDHACGQCHGGGTGQASSTGSVTTGTKALTVASATGFAVGNKIRVAGAGALEADGVTREDFDTYIASISGTTITLAGNASATVSGAVVKQNPTRTGVSYKTKSELAFRAQGIHSGVPAVPTYVTFSHSVSGLTVNVNASDSTCSGSAANCDAYTWNWGDGTPNGSGVTTSHLYAAGGSKTVTLTVEQYGITGGTKTKNITVAAPDNPPVIGSTCSWNPNTWTMSLTDTSTDDNGLKQVTVNWGDGTPISNDTTPPAFGPFTHVYLTAGSFSVTHKAYDTIGQQATEAACASTPAVPAYFAISGTVFAANGTTPLPSALVKVKKAGALIRVAYTATNGTFSAGYLKPGTYSVEVSKSGHTFALPALPSVTVGPSSAGNSILATGTVFVRRPLDLE